MLSAGRFCHKHNESVCERPTPLWLGLNGERWRCGGNVERNTQGVFEGLSTLFLKAGYPL